MCSIFLILERTQADVFWISIAVWLILRENCEDIRHINPLWNFRVVLLNLNFRGPVLSANMSQTKIVHWRSNSYIFFNKIALDSNMNECLVTHFMWNKFCLAPISGRYSMSRSGWGNQQNNLSNSLLFTINKPLASDWLKAIICCLQTNKQRNLLPWWCSKTDSNSFFLRSSIFSI